MDFSAPRARHFCGDLHQPDPARARAFAQSGDGSQNAARSLGGGATVAGGSRTDSPPDCRATRRSYANGATDGARARGSGRAAADDAGAGIVWRTVGANAGRAAAKSAAAIRRAAEDFRTQPAERRARATTATRE